MASLLPLEEAQARLLALAPALSIERVPVAEAAGRYLVEPLHARRTQPSADLSAMDGYALRSADLPGPWQVIGESAAGHPFEGTVKTGQAVRISTGGLMPAESDMVLMQEDARCSGAEMALSGALPRPLRAHVRRMGMDFCEGDQLFPAGSFIGPAQIALILAGGHNLVPLRRKSRVWIIDSGDELASDPSDCAPHQVPASNGAMLAALATLTPCRIFRPPPMRDHRTNILEALAAAAEGDVIVTSGGASVGDHDLLQPALVDWGAEIAFWKVAIKPGKPLLVARKGEQIVLGLPGNPVSSHVTAFLFLLPLLRRLAGSDHPLPTAIPMRLAAPLPAGGRRREFIRAVWNGHTVLPMANQDSSALLALARSNVLIDRAAEAPAAAAGDSVPVYLIGNGGIA